MLETTCINDIKFVIVSQAPAFNEDKKNTANYTHVYKVIFPSAKGEKKTENGNRKLLSNVYFCIVEHK